jgi:hypothetical protein
MAEILLDESKTADDATKTRVLDWLCECDPIEIEQLVCVQR